MVHITAEETQVYMISSVVLYEQDVLIVETLSGVSGKNYYYYIDNSGRRPVLAMLTKITKGDSETKTVSGIRYENI